jgi:hypothetical protein
VATVKLGMAGQWKLTASVQGMAGMTMDGDGSANFIVTAHPASAGGAAGRSPLTNMPAPSNVPASFPWLLIIGALVVIGVIVGIVLGRGRGKQ